MSTVLTNIRDNHTRGTVADFLRAKIQDNSHLKAVASVAATFRKRAFSGLQSARDFILPNEQEQVHEKTDIELVTWLVIKERNA